MVSQSVQEIPSIVLALDTFGDPRRYFAKINEEATIARSILNSFVPPAVVKPVSTAIPSMDVDVVGSCTVVAINIED